MFIKKGAVLLLFVYMAILPVYAYELDLSVDEEIRKNYDTSKLEQDALPGLPPVLKGTTGSSTTTKSSSTQKSGVVPPASVPKTTIETDYSGGGKVSKTMTASAGGDSFSATKVKKGTKFRVRSQTKVSDTNASGARMSFVSLAPVYATYVTFPSGTTLKGVIEDSHQPTVGGNGGLLKLKADTVIYNGSSHNIDAKVTKANGKKVFFNNIKGKRGYLHGIADNVGKGQKFYQKSIKTANSWYMSNPIGAICSPVPRIVGTVGYTVNFLASPLTAVWAKGSHITLPSGTDYTIKLREDLYMY